MSTFSRDNPYPVGTVVSLKRSGEFALIKDRAFLMNKTFLHYEGPIEGRRPGNYCLLHEEIELEALPIGYDHE